MANNLLDKASIILTPTAYDNGKALCVKPSDGSGDFDFSRNSAATRVNAQGLVENVQILSSNLVQNPSFSEEGVQEVSNGSFSQEGVQLVTNGSFDTDSNWNKGSGWSISGGKATSDGTQVSASYLSQTLSGVSQGKQYITEFDIDVISGSFRFNTLGNNLIVTESGHYVIYSTSVSGITLYLEAQVGFTGSIDNVSVREVGQDWTLGGGWSIAEDKAVCDGTNSPIDQYSVTTIGKTYKVDITVADMTTSAVTIRLGTSSSDIIGSIIANGTYTFYGTVASSTTFRIRSGAGFDGSITNISVKEVLQDWSVEDYGAVSASAVITPNTEGVKLEKTVSADWRSSFLVQPISYTVGSQYKITFRLKNGNLPSGGVYVRASYSSSVENIASNLVLTNDWVEYTYYFLAGVGSTDISFGNVNWQNAGVGQYFYIDDVSVIEITTDTNLPRISYENFSYQDALGSELVTNGDFATDTNWIKQSSWTINNGAANYDGISSGNYLRQSWSPLTIGKTYRMTFDISDGSAYLQIRSGTSLLFEGINIVLYGTGSHVIEAKAISNLDNLRIYAYTSGGGTSFSIDNVSVKEITGQSVVPNSGCGSWLWEPQSTQLLTYSELFSNSYWQNFGVGTTPILETGFLAPDGTNNAFKISNANQDSFLAASANVVNSNSTRSIYARTVSGTGTAQLLSHNSNTNNIFTITEQWQRFEVNTTTTGTGATTFYAVEFRGSGTLSEVIIWGANATNDQDYATSYIPSNGSQVTRNQDVCTNGGSLATINSTEGVLYAEIAALSATGNNSNITLTDGTGNNRIYIYYLIDNSISVIYNINSTGASLNNFSLANITDQNKIAVRWGNSNVSVWINGTSVLSNTTSNFLPNTLNVLNFSKPAGSGNFNGKTKALAVWKEALSDSELQSLTTI